MLVVLKAAGELGVQEGAAYVFWVDLKYHPPCKQNGPSYLIDWQVCSQASKIFVN